MSRILCTFPGRHGDALWMLPSARALASFYGEPVDLMLSEKYSSLEALLSLQPYLDEILVNHDWQVREDAPISPREAPLEGVAYRWERIFHLGFSGWPTKSLPYEIWDSARAELEKHHGGYSGKGLRLEEPWITRGLIDEEPRSIFVGFTDEWAELKMGLVVAAAGHFPEWKFRLISHIGSRQREWRVLPPNVVPYECSWRLASAFMAKSTLFFGCCSALWVLANAMGKRTVIVEPSEMRHNACFDLPSPRNRFLRGDGGGRFDARAAIALLEEVLD